MVLVYGWPSLSRHILYDIGDGSRVKFWQDRWCGETSLAIKYPDLFRFCRNNDASVAELMMSTNGVLFWDVRFVRGVHARDLEAISDFMVQYMVRLQGGEVRIKCVGFLAKLRVSWLVIIIEF